MIRKFALTAIALAVAACADKTGTHSQQTVFQDDSPKNKRTVSSLEHPQGDFRTKGEDPGAEARIVSCSFSPGHIDDRLRTGMAFQIEDKWMAKDGGFSGYGKVQKNIAAIDHHGNTLNLTLNIQGSNGELKQFCNYGDKDGKLTTDCKVTSTLPGGALLAAKTPKNCWIAWDAKHKTTSHVESGAYAMRGGRVVSSVRASRFETGTLNCDDKDLGKGTVEAVTIYSADIPDIEHPTCGNGAQVYYNEIAKTTSGTVVNFKKFEIISY